jgi:deoxycytidylate deaminase
MKDKYGRPDWHSFYISMCFLIARRSIDPNTKHGCVIVDKNNKILSTGYNGPPAGLDDSKLDLTRPGKYKLLEHSELNAILNAKGCDLEGSTFYITGFPCHTCFRQMKIVKAARIIHGGQGSHCLSDEDSKAISALNSGDNQIEVVDYQNMKNSEESTVENVYQEALDAYKKVVDNK